MAYRPIEYIDPSGQKTQWTLDDIGQVIEQRILFGNVDDIINGETDDIVEAFEYTPALTEEGDSPKIVLTSTEWVNAANGLVAERGTAWETDPSGENSHYVYDASGNLVQYTDRRGKRIDYEYDALNRRTKEIWMEDTGFCLMV